jgi:hypothetical protein
MRCTLQGKRAANHAIAMPNHWGHVRVEVGGGGRGEDMRRF